MFRSPHGIVALACTVALALPGSAVADPIIFSASGGNPAAIQMQVDAFRNTLGANNGNALGSQGGGRREINWDGGGAATTLSGTPFDVFNTAVPRGAVFTTPGTGFVQAPPSGLATTFNNATYATNFPVFSLQRLFSPVGSNITDVLFFVPGTTDPAFTRGFGAVFSDVDSATSTSLQFFDQNGGSLGTFFAPTANNGLSFLGVFFNAGEAVTRVRITGGNVAPGPNDNPPGADVVVMDDFIFGEPASLTTIPEPSTLALLAGLAVVAVARRRVSHRERTA